MASELTEIKSKMLLPEKDDEDEEEEKDPREQLIERLEEYKRFKDAADSLKDMADNRSHFFSGQFNSYDDIFIEVDSNSEALEGITLFKLAGFFQNIINVEDDNSESGRHRVRPQQFKVREQMDKIKYLLENSKRGRISFKDFAANASCRAEIAVTFFALLELIRVGRIMIKQKKPFADILVFERS